MKRRRLFSLLTALALLAALLPARAAEEVFSIATPQDLARFAQLCTKDTWSQGVTAELTADLELDGSFAPIPIFQGTFHGNGHTISGLSVTGKGSRVGLFRTLTASAVVEDLTVEGNLSPQGTAASVGLLAGENHGTLRRCAAAGTVSGQENVGGLVGSNEAEGSLLSCTSSALVTGVANAGGVAGQNLGLIQDCSNTGAVNVSPDQEAPTSVGGIAGLSRGTIRHCVNSGEVGYQHVGYNMGGIAGLQSGEITGCTNTGPVRGRKDVGGVVGQFEPYTSLSYGPSPAQALDDSLSALLDQLGGLADTLDSMAGRGVEDAQAIGDALAAIQERAYQAGTQGGADLREASDQLYQYTGDMGDALDELRASLSRLNDRAGDQLQTALDQSDRLRQALSELARQTDRETSQTVEELERTVSAIHSQLQTALSHRQALEQEVAGVAQYVEEVARLVLAGELEQALQLPFPTLNLKGHLNAMESALQEAVRLAAGLPASLSSLYNRLSDALRENGREMDDALSDLNEALDGLLQAEQQFSREAAGSLDQVSLAADQIRDLLKHYADTLGDQAQSTVDDIHGQLTAIQDRTDQMTQGAAQDRQELHAITQAMLDQLEQVRQAIRGLGEEPELTVNDLTDHVEEGPGFLGSCTVSASVQGDVNVGGIAGAVAPELGDDPEATFDLGDMELLSDVTATMRAVIRQCRYDGDLSAKTECGGGIAGRCEAGAILDCAARGTVETGGDYCGGIAGRTRGKILRCAALVDLDGQSWLGGVAGLGKDLTDCRSMVQAEGDGEYRGAVAGEATGTLTGNCYLLEELAGLDGVDYAGKAEGLEFDAFSQLSGLPEDFLTFSYRFESEGELVAEVPFSYGGDLDLSLVPAPPKGEDSYGQWPGFPTQNLRRSRVIQAQFAQPTTTLADQEGVARLLAEGSFSPDAALTVTQNEQPGQAGLDAAPVGAWQYTVTGSKEDTVTLRLYTGEVKHPAAALLQNGVWVRADSTLDGSYLVFQAPVQGEIALLEENNTPVWLLLAGAGALLALVAAGGLLHRRKKAKIAAGSGIFP